MLDRSSPGRLSFGSGGMSLATLVGFILGLVLIFGAIVLSTDNFLVFLHLAGFLARRRTLAATFVAYEPRYVIIALRIRPPSFSAIGWAPASSRAKSAA